MQCLSKTEFRREALKIIAKLSKGERQRQSDIVQEKFLQSQLYKDSKNIGFYVSISSEVSTNNIITSALRDNKSCFIPYCPEIGPMRMLRLYGEDDFVSLTKSSLKFFQHEEAENKIEAEDSGLDVLVVPGVAFTMCGKRMGRGRGYYDWYLNSWKGLIIPRTVSLAFNEQIFEDIPVEPTDYVIDYILSTRLDI